MNRFRATLLISGLACALGATPATAPVGAPAPWSVAPRPLPGDIENCGLDPQPVPDFALTDVNPNSSSFGETMRLDEQLGQVLVVYWAQAT